METLPALYATDTNTWCPSRHSELNRRSRPTDSGRTIGYSSITECRRSIMDFEGTSGFGIVASAASPGTRQRSDRPEQRNQRKQLAHGAPERHAQSVPRVGTAEDVTPADHIIALAIGLAFA